MSFGVVAETYNRVRPPYSAQLLDQVREALALSSQARVLDLGAGTGRLTRELVRRFASVVAVEPDHEMRALIDAPTVLSGRAEEIPLESASVDAVFVGEAFHWFETTAALAEISRVLVPGGGLAIVSVDWWETEPPLPAAAFDLLREQYDRCGGAVQVDWEAFAVSPFEPLREEVLEDEVSVDAETLLAMYSTLSTIASLPVEARTELLTRLRPLLTGRYRLPVRHRLRWTRLQLR